MTTLLLLVTDEVREWQCRRKPGGVCVPLLEHLMINIQSSLRGTDRWWEDWNSLRAEGFRHTEQDGKILGQLWRKRRENLKFLLLVVSQLLKLPYRLFYLCEAFLGSYEEPRSLGHWRLLPVSEWFLWSQGDAFCGIPKFFISFLEPGLHKMLVFRLSLWAEKRSEKALGWFRAWSLEGAWLEDFSQLLRG